MPGGICRKGGPTQLRNFKRNLLFLTVPAVLAVGAVSYGSVAALAAPSPSPSPTTKSPAIPKPAETAEPAEAAEPVKPAGGTPASAVR